MQSPITQTDQVELWDEIPAETVIDLYSDQFDLDVRELFGSVDSVKIYKCIESGYRFYHPFSLVGDGKFYADLEATMPYSQSRRWEHRLGASYMKEGMKVLEVGCGPGVFMSTLVEKGCEPIGLELNESAAEQSRAKGLDARQELVDAFSLDHADEFDGVCFFQVLEHVDDVRSFLESAIKVLKPGGLLVVGVPNNNPYLHRYDRLHTMNLPPHHMGLWDEASLRNLPRYFDIELQDLLVEPLMEPRKQMRAVLSHYGWNRTARLVSRLPFIVDRVVRKTIGKFCKGRNLLAVYRKK